MLLNICCSIYYIRNFYRISRYEPHVALLPRWLVVFSFLCAAFITATSEVRVICLLHYIFMRFVNVIIILIK